MSTLTARRVAIGAIVPGQTIAYGPRAVHKVIEAIATRSGFSGPLAVTTVFSDGTRETWAPHARVTVIEVTS
jgi:hypothetical protein